MIFEKNVEIYLNYIEVMSKYIGVQYCNTLLSQNLFFSIHKNFIIRFKMYKTTILLLFLLYVKSEKNSNKR